MDNNCSCELQSGSQPHNMWTFRIPLYQTINYYIESTAGSPTVSGYLESLWEHALLKLKEGSWPQSVRFNLSYCRTIKFYSVHTCL